MCYIHLLYPTDSTEYFFSSASHITWQNKFTERNQLCAGFQVDEESYYFFPYFGHYKGINHYEYQTIKLFFFFLRDISDDYRCWHQEEFQGSFDLNQLSQNFL